MPKVLRVPVGPRRSVQSCHVSIFVDQRPRKLPNLHRERHSHSTKLFQERVPSVCLQELPTPLCLNLKCVWGPVDPNLRIYNILEGRMETPGGKENQEPFSKQKRRSGGPPKVKRGKSFLFANDEVHSPSF